MELVFILRGDVGCDITQVKFGAIAIEDTGRGEDQFDNVAAQLGARLSRQFEG